MVNIVSRIDDAVKVANVLASVSDKTGLDKFVPSLLGINPHLRVYSTGGTYPVSYTHLTLPTIYSV